MRALFTAATGMEAQQLRIDTVAHNLANVNTTGYRRSRAEFEDLFYETLQSPGAASVDGTQLPTGAQVGHGVRLTSITRVHSQGDRQNTSRELDVAVNGDGFFQVETPNGDIAYTRDGAFELDNGGNLVTQNGLRVAGGITVPAEAVSVTILRDGTVSAQLADATTSTNLGQLQLARFVNPAGLRAVGGNLLLESDASGNPEIGTPGLNGFGQVAQGFLESSNVNMAEELVRMILAQRAFEVNSRVITTADEMLQRASNL